MSPQAQPIPQPEKPTDPSSLLVELMLLRQRMVRDLEQFLTLELSNPTAAWIRLINFARPEYQPCC